MTRQANGSPPRRFAAGVTLVFKPHELRMLKRNVPGPSGALGGYQRMENYLVENVAEYAVFLDPIRLERLIRYIGNYGSGGPNGRLRDAGIPALRRAGIEVRV